MDQEPGFSSAWGSGTTLVAAAVLGNQVVGVVVGDSRGYVVPLDGPTDLATSNASKARLGSGEAEALPWRVILRPRDVVVLLSDGAWGPLGTGGVEKAVRSAVLKHFSEVPQTLLDSAAKRGRADDMTAVALRLMSS
jgi:serine/threonine protein phosphatase PrpC